MVFGGIVVVCLCLVVFTSIWWYVGVGWYFVVFGGMVVVC